MPGKCERRIYASLMEGRFQEHYLTNSQGTVIGLKTSWQETIYRDMLRLRLPEQPARPAFIEKAEGRTFLSY